MSNINVIEAVRSYVNQMIEKCGQTMKVLVMDKETASIISMVYAQSEILQKEVFLFERIDLGGRKTMKDLSAMCFLRPTDENITALVRELSDPKYDNYFIYFTNFVEMSDIKALAEADKFECVRGIFEFYADYLAINTHLFSLNISNNYIKNYEWNENVLRRTVQGLISLLLSLRKKSATIRYQKSSNMARMLADKLSSTLKRQADFSVPNPNDFNQTVVLIVDRREDAITPLLNQWTYQAMVHELIGIKNNRVSLIQVPDIAEELKEVVMNAEYDDFYSNNLYSNFGEIATNIKALMEHFQEKHKSQSKIESITDMKTFIENYPQFKKLSGTVSKHVTIVSELSRLVGIHHLLEVSETEQHLVCQGDHNEVVQKIKRLIKDDKIQDLDILRLLALYELRYERHASNEFNTLKYEAQKHRKLPEKYTQFLQAIVEYGGLKFRQADLFNTQTPMAITRQFIRGLRGVDNIYAQHVPLIKDLLEQLLRGKLKDTSYPNVNAKEQINLMQQSQQGQINKPSEIIVYVIGGITYEESYHIQLMNKQNARIICGSSTIHNFSSFIDEVLAGSPTTLSAASTELLSSKRR